MDLSVLKLAFARHVLDTLARSDGFVEVIEQAFVLEACPNAAMQWAGLMDEFGVLTAAYSEATQEAMERLQVELPIDERLGMLGLFFRLCLVDGHFDHGEGSLLYESARHLGISAHQFDRFLSLQEEVGELDLDAPDTGETP